LHCDGAQIKLIVIPDIAPLRDASWTDNQLLIEVNMFYSGHILWNGVGIR
jgi:hypothetical protein